MSTTSPTAAGHPETALPDAALIDAINQVFALFRANYHNQYYAAFGDDSKSVAITKKLWLQSLQDFPAQTICRAAEKIIADSDYLPTLHKMLSACTDVALPAGMPSPQRAYIEACNAPSPKAAYNWSHPAVYLAGRDCGWYVLNNQPENIALPQFRDIYQRYCQRAAAGETLVVEKPAMLEERARIPVDRDNARKKISALKELFE